MDILTQIALGSAVGAALLPKESVRKTLVISGIIAAIPDMDMLLAINADEYQELLIHRSFSHAILPFMALSALIAWFSLKLNIFKSYSFPKQFAVIFTILFTHALLDCLTTWGTQLFWPLDYRIATQTEYVIDFFYSGILLMGIVPLFIFPKHFSSRIYLKSSLILSSIYLLILFAYQQVFIHDLKQRPEYQGAIRITTQPVLDYAYNYRTVVEMEDHFIISRKPYSLFDKNVPGNYFIPKNKDLKDEIETYFNLKPLENLARGYLAYQKESNNIYKINDLRYPPQKSITREYNSVFFYYIIIDGDKAEFRQNMRTGQRLGKILRAIFR